MTSPYDLPEWAALQAAIRAAPGDDLPRLVAADWLEEHGQGERAEFIRVQIEYARLHPHLSEHKAEAGCDTCSRGFAMSELLLNGRLRVPRGAPVRFAGDCPHRLCKLEGRTGPRIEWDWHRGFISEIRCTLADWCGGEFRANRDLRPGMFVTTADVTPVCGIGPAVVAAHPVERVVLTDREPVQVSGGVWEFPVSDGPDRRGAIPWAVYDLFPDQRPTTRELALAALSAALIAWALAPRPLD